MSKRAWLFLHLKPFQWVGFESDQLAFERHICEAYCAEQGLSIVGESVDIGRYGPRQRRPVLDRILAEAEAHTFDVLVALYPQRLPRSAAPFEHVLTTLERAGVELRFGTPRCPSAADYLFHLRAEEEAERARRKEIRQANLRFKETHIPTPPTPRAQAE